MVIYDVFFLQNGQEVQSFCEWKLSNKSFILEGSVFNTNSTIVLGPPGRVMNALQMQ